MPNKAFNYFQKMEEIFRCKPLIRSYNALLNAFIGANLLDKAEQEVFCEGERWIYYRGEKSEGWKGDQMRRAILTVRIFLG